MFKHTIPAAIAFSMLSVPMAQAQHRHDAHRHGQHYSAPKKPIYSAPGKQRARKPAQKQHRWSRGHRVPDWQRKRAVRNHHRHGLRRPGNGQRWVKVGNDCLLIGLATGIIAGIVPAR